MTNMVFDARALPPAPAYSGTGTWADLTGTMTNISGRGWDVPASVKQRSMEGYEAEARSAGVVVTGLPARIPNTVWGGVANEDVQSCAELDPGARVWFGAVDHAHDPLLAGGLAERGARGIVVEPFLSATPTHVDDPSVDVLYDTCQSLGLPALVMLGGELGDDGTWCDPARIDRVAARFPRLRLVVVHAGWPYTQAMLGVAYRRTNVWLMPDVYFPGLPGETDLVLALRTFLRDRCIYASSYPYCPHSPQLQRIRALGLGHQAERSFLYDNAARLFGVPDVPTLAERK
jgi:hypothetical protein